MLVNMKKNVMFQKMYILVQGLSHICICQFAISARIPIFNKNELIVKQDLVPCSVEAHSIEMTS